MLERVCRFCNAGNSLEAALCVRCGASLEAQALAQASHEPQSLVQRLRQAPVLRSPAAKSLAVGLAALAVDMGAHLLRGRSKDPAPSPQQTALALRPRRKRGLMRQRVWEEFNADGSLRRRVVENLVIRDEDQ